jgi:hypothetical protein
MKVHAGSVRPDEEGPLRRSREATQSHPPSGPPLNRKPRPRLDPPRECTHYASRAAGKVGGMGGVRGRGPPPPPPPPPPKPPQLWLEWRKIPPDAPSPVALTAAQRGRYTWMRILDGGPSGAGLNESVAASGRTASAVINPDEQALLEGQPLIRRFSGNEVLAPRRASPPPIFAIDAIQYHWNASPVSECPLMSPWRPRKTSPGAGYRPRPSRARTTPRKIVPQQAGRSPMSMSSEGESTRNDLFSREEMIHSIALHKFCGRTRPVHSAQWMITG